MSSAIIRMHMAGANKKYNQLKADDFSTTNYIEHCQKCSFQKICKTNSYETTSKYTVRDEHFQN